MADRAGQFESRDLALSDPQQERGFPNLQVFRGFRAGEPFRHVRFPFSTLTIPQFRTTIRSLAMAAEPNPVPICPLCGEPCALEDCATDSHGRALHEDCYRKALIGGDESL
jgi:hypothetical protein